MNAAFEQAAKSHGGKHANGVALVHDALAKGKTTAERAILLRVALVGNLAGMIAAGAPTSAIFDALGHLVEHKQAVLDAEANGV